MKQIFVFALIASFIFIFPTTSNAQLLKKKADKEEVAVAENDKKLKIPFLKKEEPQTEEEKKWYALKTDHKEAKDTVKATKKERKAAEAREKAARARAEAIKAQKKAVKAEKKADKKETQAEKTKMKLFGKQ